MAEHNTLIDSTACEIEGGTVLLDGAALGIELGMTLVGGVAYEIPFSPKITTVTISGEASVLYAQYSFDGGDSWLSQEGTFEYERPFNITVKVKPSSSNGGTSTIKLNGTQVASGTYYSPAEYTFEPDTDNVSIEFTKNPVYSGGSVVAYRFDATITTS